MVGIGVGGIRVVGTGIGAELGGGIKDWDGDAIPDEGGGTDVGTT